MLDKPVAFPNASMPVCQRARGALLRTIAQQHWAEQHWPNSIGSRYAAPGRAVKSPGERCQSKQYRLHYNPMLVRNSDIVNNITTVESAVFSSAFDKATDVETTYEGWQAHGRSG